MRRRLLPSGIALIFLLVATTPGSLGATAGSGHGAVAVDGTGASGHASHELDGPTGLAVDAHGDVFVADTQNCRVQEITPDGTVTTAAGSVQGTCPGSIGFPTGVAVAPTGALYVVSPTSDKVFAVKGGKTRSVVSKSGIDSSAHELLNEPMGIAFGPTGLLFIADTEHCAVRKIGGGVLATVAGNGSCGETGLNGPATQAQLFDPTAVAVDATGNLWIADRGVGYVAEVPKATGNLQLIAGGGIYASYLAGGPAVSTVSELNSPNGLAVAPSGAIYVADTEEGAVRVITPSRRLTSIKQSFVEPYGVALAPNGDLYVSDEGANKIYRVSATKL